MHLKVEVHSPLHIWSFQQIQKPQETEAFGLVSRSHATPSWTFYLKAKKKGDPLPL